MSDHLISLAAGSVTIDETSGLQNGTDLSPPPGEDNDDNDVLVSTIPTTLSGRLNTLAASYNANVSNAIEAAESTGDVITINAGESPDDLALTGAGGAVLNGLDSGLNTTTGHDILLYNDAALFTGGDNNIVYGIDAVTGEVVFAVYLEPTATGAKLWTVLYEPIQHGNTGSYDEAVDLTDKIYVTALDEVDFSFDDAPPGDNLFMAFSNDGGAQTIVVTGRDPANESDGENISSGDTVNTSGQTSVSLGTNGQQVKPGEGLYFTFVTNMNPDYIAGPGAGNNPGQPLSQTEADEESNIDFTGLLPATGAEFLISQVNPGSASTTVSIKITAYTTDLEIGDEFVDGLGDGDDVAVTITGVTINGVAVASTDLEFVGDSVIVSGVKTGDMVGYTTSGNHTRVLIESAQPLKGSGSNRTFDIGGFNLTQLAADDEEVGSKIIFEDDGPQASVTAGTEPGAVYLFDGNQTGGNFEGDNGTGVPGGDIARTGSPTSVTVDYSGAFTTSTSTGSDGGSVSTTYSLVLDAGITLGTTAVQFGGADLTSGGTTVVWHAITGGYAGVLSGTTTQVFSITVDASGNVTFSQLRVIDQPVDVSGAPYTTDTLLLSDNQLDLRKSVTVTDGDSDQATSSYDVDLGGNFGIGDDGPKVTVDTSGTEPGAVYLYDGNQTGGNFEGNMNTGLSTADAPRDGTPTSVDVAFAGAFGGSSSAGADGGSASASYTLVLDGGIVLGTSVVQFGGADLTSGGTTVVWKAVTGGYAGVLSSDNTTEVFKITVNGTTGVVTFSQSRVIDHPVSETTVPYTYTTDILALSDNQISVQKTVTVTDFEGDTAQASASVDLGGNFGIGDDGPKVSVTTSGSEPSIKYSTDASPTSVMSDFSTAFNTTSSNGADGGSASTAYSIIIAAGKAGTQVVFNDGTSNVGLTSGGTSVIWTAVTGGYAGVLSSDGTTKVFDITVDAAGKVTFTQYLTFDHTMSDTSNYDTDILTLADGQVSVQKTVTVTDNDTDQAASSASVDLGGNFGVKDDGPAITVNDIGTALAPESFAAATSTSTTPAWVNGTWTDDAGADGFTSLNVTLTGYAINGGTTQSVNVSLGTLTAPNGDTTDGDPSNDGDFVYTGSITADFTDDGIANAQKVDFRVTLEDDGTYEFTLTDPPTTVTTLSTNGGNLDAGGPDSVRVLTLSNGSDVIFSAVKATANSGQIQSFLNTSESNIETNFTSLLSPAKMNVSTAGIGNGNNNFDGNANSGVDGATTSGNKVDESFVIDPDGFLVSGMRIFIDNSQPLEGTDDIWYRIYYNDGTTATVSATVEPTAVLDIASLPTNEIPLINGSPLTGQYFDITSINNANDIDAVQLFMGEGVVKIPVINFSVSSSFDPDPLRLDFTATLVDDDNGNNDSSSDPFSIYLA